MNGRRFLYLALLLSVLIHASTLAGFFTHDDFFHFLISRANNISEFIGFFNPTSQPLGYGWYRPISNQLYYFIGLKVFGLDPLPMRLMMLANHILNICLVWIFTRQLTRSRTISGLAAFLYAGSASLFANIYLVGVQERVLTTFFLISTISFIKYLKTQRAGFYLSSLVSFVFALWCKESAIMLPAVFLLIIWFYRDELIPSAKKYIWTVTPPFMWVLIYLYFKFAYFGLAQGDSYIWTFSPRVLNTFTWYGLWSVNVPEMLVDYVGPGLRLNPNLFKFWKPQIISLFLLLISFFSMFLVKVSKRYRQFTSFDLRLLLFGIIWFLITILPVLGLPLHKFPHYLSVPLVGSLLVFSSAISRVFGPSEIKRLMIIYFLSYLVNFWISTRTHWAYTGQFTALRVHNYLATSFSPNQEPATIIFYDTPQDAPLPWDPSQVLQTVLGDNAYFQLYYPGRLSARYQNQKPDKIESNQILIPARQFLGY